jgi:methyl-accepting chemotaxis protein
MLSSMSMGKRMGLAFAVLIALVAITGGVGYWGLQSIAATADRILTVDVGAADASGQAQAATANLRRYEKDYFLNIGDHEKEETYLDKWESERDLLKGHLATILRLELGTGAEQQIDTMLRSLETYEAGFARVREQIRAGSIATPQDANRAISPYKDARSAPSRRTRASSAARAWRAPATASPASARSRRP